MLYACVERFDVTSTVGKILGTKRGLNVTVLAKIAVPLEFPSVLVCFGFLQRQFIVGREKQKSTF